MLNTDDIYGGVTTRQKVSFAYGTIAQAASDTMPGSINFGFDSVTNTGAIFMEKRLMTSRVLSMSLGAAAIDGMHTVVVKFLNEQNEVSELTFKSVDESLIQTLLDSSTSGGGTVYMAGEYIAIDNDAHTISVDYDPLYNKIKSDLVTGGIGDQTEINIHQSEQILNIQKSYLTDIEKISGEESDTYVITKSTKENETADAVDTSIVIEVVRQDKFDEKFDVVNTITDALDNKIVDVSANVAEIGDKVVDVSTAVDEIVVKENELEQTVASVSSTVSSVTERVDDVERGLIDLSTNIVTREDVAEIDEDIAKINSSVNVLESDVAALKNATSGSWIDIRSLLN